MKRVLVCVGLVLVALFIVALVALAQSLDKHNYMPSMQRGISVPPIVAGLGPVTPTPEVKE